jgi:hypothetical protein
MYHLKYQMIYVISGILIILGFSHLVFNVYNTKQFTFTWIFLMLLVQPLLIMYGVLNNVYGIYLLSIILIIGILYILYVKLNYDINDDVETELKIKNII